ncbi:MAG: glycosyl transferase family 1 [Anaerolineales bacterium]
MNIGFISTRLAGTDGVSLETAKLATLVEELGHEVFYCAGELEESGPPGLLVPEMHFEHPRARALHAAAFGGGRPPADLGEQITEMAEELQEAITTYVQRFEIDLLFPQNALAIPMHIPLAVALTDYIAETGMPTLAHHHDFYWERERFAGSAVPELLERCFPPDLPSVRHLVINSLAQETLRKQKGIEAELLPNIFDFETPPPGPDAYVAGMWQDLGLPRDARVVLQPTRVVPRKGIEMAIELVRRLAERQPRSRHVLVISHHAGDEGMAYLQGLQAQAERVGVDLRYLADRFAPERGRAPDGTKIYSLWDAYPQADFVTYPSLIEGFGNAFLETIYFYRPLLVNRYPVYEADLGPLGFRCVEIDGEVTDTAVSQVLELLQDQALREEVVQHNYEVAKAHFSYEAVTPLLQRLLRE